MTRLALTLGLTVMDACWLYVWSALLGRFGDPARAMPLLSPLSIVAFQLVAAFTTEHLGRHALTSRRVRVALLTTGVAAVLVAIRFDQYPASSGLDWLAMMLRALAVAIGSLTAPALAFILGLAIWWRGINLGRQTSTFVEVEGAFRLGIGMLVAFGIVQVVSTHGEALTALQADTTIYVVGFFFVSLLSLALGRLESLSTRTRSIGINSQWLSVLILLSAAVVLVALALGQIVSFDLLVIATRPFFDVLGRVLLVLVYLLVIPIAYIVELLIYALLSLVQPDSNRQRPQPPEPNDIDNFLQRLFAQGIPAEVLGALKAAGALLLFALALVILNRAFRRWRPAGADAEAALEERDSVFTVRRLRDLLLAWWKSLFRRGHGEVGAGALHGSDSASPSLEVERVSIRTLYRDLLRLGESIGVTRGTGTTPLEHEAPLVATLEPPRTVQDLTEAYVEVRYAERDTPDREVERLTEALRSVRVREPEN